VTGTPTGGVVVAGNNDQFVLVVHALSSEPGRLDPSPTPPTSRRPPPTTTTPVNDETSTVTSNVVAVADLQVTKHGAGDRDGGDRHHLQHHRHQ